MFNSKERLWADYSRSSWAGIQSRSKFIILHMLAPKEILLLVGTRGRYYFVEQGKYPWESLSALCIQHRDPSKIRGRKRENWDTPSLLDHFLPLPPSSNCSQCLISKGQKGGFGLSRQAGRMRSSSWIGILLCGTGKVWISIQGESE